MSAAKPERRQRVRHLSRRKLSQTAIAAELGVSRTRARQLIDEGRLGDQHHEAFLAGARAEQLRRHLDQLEVRRAALTRLIAATRGELESRAVDEVIGLGR